MPLPLFPRLVQFVRRSKSVTLTIANGAAISDAFNFESYSHMIVHMPAAWTAASIGFMVASTEDGTYQELFTTVPAASEITLPTAGKAFLIPTDAVPGHWVKLWSQTAGSGVNQLAERTLVVDLKA